MKGNQSIQEHYTVAFQCLEECLKGFRCDVLLMLTLTLSSSSVTPRVKSETRHFEAGLRRAPAIVAATLVTRLLWFLKLEQFSWEQDKRAVLRVSEMKKK